MSTGTTTQTQAEVEITELLSARAAAMRSGDAALLSAQYTPDAVVFSLAPPLQQPLGPNEEGLRGWFATFDSAVDYEISQPGITVAGDLAFCHSLNRLTAVPKGGSESFTLWFRYSLGLQRVDGTWRIAHEHQSVPFAMDGSFAALLDLEP
ncbi:MAG: nuclear transport factor 2 family protein [Propionibacteriaceae bacterium]